MKRFLIINFLQDSGHVRLAFQPKLGSVRTRLLWYVSSWFISHQMVGITPPTWSRRETLFLRFFSNQFPGYLGDHCESCDAGYYGNPTVLGGSCTPCSCGGGPCDVNTGECVQCRGNTEGPRCERCKPLYYGSPRSGDCKRKSNSLLMCPTWARKIQGFFRSDFDFICWFEVVFINWRSIVVC